MQSVNPFSGKIIQNYPEYTTEEVNLIIKQVDNAFQQWKHTDFDYRAGLMRKLQSKLLERKAELASIMVAEMGKVFREAEGEISKCALVCGYYADNEVSLRV